MIGVDEVGRGAWAGPLLVVAARPIGKLPMGLKDSKLLTKKQRLKLLDKLSSCCQFGEGWVEAVELDDLGLAEGLRLGVARALLALSANTDERILMDGKVNYCPADFINSQCQVNADALVSVVSAASVYAKVTRDNYMTKLASKHPLYNFEKHVGYGTANHRQALDQLGAIAGVHRLSFHPLKTMVEWASA